ncbi:MAG: inositol monophosphatase family protein [Phycisphaerales bacterium JB040]
MPDDRADRLRFAEEIAIEAGRKTLEWFNTPTLEADTKRDGSPVTAADRAAERLLRDRIERAYPDDAILGEEFDDRPGTSGWRWVLDPIDGTKSFVRGVPLYGTMVACERDGRAQIGVIRMPALDETVGAAINGPSHWKPAGSTATRPLARGDAATLADALGVWTCPEYYHQLGLAPVYHALERTLGLARGWSDCYAFVLLATGRADAVIEAGLQTWDLAAAVPILHEAGLTLSDWRGAPNPSGQRVLASTPAIHAELIELIASHNQTG